MLDCLLLLSSWKNVKLSSLIKMEFYRKHHMYCQNFRIILYDGNLKKCWFCFKTYFLHISLCFTLVLTKGCTYSVIMDFTLLWRVGDLPTMNFHWKACTTPKQPGIAQMSPHQYFCHLLSPGSLLSTWVELLVPVVFICMAHLQFPAFPSLSSGSD